MQNTQQTEAFRVVGINYKKSDSAVRGLFAVNQDQYAALLAAARDFGVSDLFVVSTCNRTEMYGFSASADQMAALICSVTAGDANIFSDICYAKEGREAIQHLYHVAAGLDSQILGDYEILGQIRTAVKFAKARGFIGTYMERVLNSVMQASKAVKTNTELSGGTVSVSFAAIQYIREYLGEAAKVTDHKIVLVGTGKIGRVTCRNMVEYLGTHNITLVNRTEATAQELAEQLKLQSAPLEALGAEVQSADIVVVSTNATQPVILAEHLQEGSKKLVIDISVPCNVAEEARTLPGVTFVDVDMLSRIKDETLQKRSAEVPKAVAIIEEHISEFLQWCEMRKHVPVLKEVKSKLMGLPLDPALFAGHMCSCPEEKEEKVQKVINNLATRMRADHAPGCHYIQAINDFIA